MHEVVLHAAVLVFDAPVGVGEAEALFAFVWIALAWIGKMKIAPVQIDAVPAVQSVGPVAPAVVRDFAARCDAVAEQTCLWRADGLPVPAQRAETADGCCQQRMIFAPVDCSAHFAAVVVELAAWRCPFAPVLFDSGIFDFGPYVGGWR